MHLHTLKCIQRKTHTRHAAHATAHRCVAGTALCAIPPAAGGLAAGPAGFAQCQVGDVILSGRNFCKIPVRNFA